jgi:hypothetical protein
MSKARLVIAAVTVEKHPVSEVARYCGRPLLLAASRPRLVVVTEQKKHCRASVSCFRKPFFSAEPVEQRPSINV